MRKDYEIEVLWTVFPLHPDIPEEGLELGRLYAGRQLELQQKQAYQKQVADELSLPYSLRHKTYNSRLAQELGKWAEARGKGYEYHNAVFRAYFVACQNIATEEALLDIAKSVGLPREEAQRVMETRAFRKVVDLEWSLAESKGVTEVPTFLMGEWAAVGFQPYLVFEELMKLNAVKKRAFPG